MALPRLVLLRPRNADNLGAVARAMKNFGLSDWVVVSPNPKLLESPGLHRLAVKSGELLDSVRRVDTLAEAVADCTWVVGTTDRTLPAQRRRSPRELSREAEARGDATWALVFGDERSGLTNEDLARCDALSFIPSSPAQPSLNLAQAVVVYAYALGAEARPEASPPAPALADDAQLRTVELAMDRGLVAARFLRREGESRHALQDLMASLRRARLTRAEATLWTAAFQVMAKHPRA
jgi:TrmH family RNA methyltransferase